MTNNELNNKIEKILRGYPRLPHEQRDLELELLRYFEKKMTQARQEAIEECIEAVGELKKKELERGTQPCRYQTLNDVLQALNKLKE